MSVIILTDIGSQTIHRNGEYRTCFYHNAIYQFIFSFNSMVFGYRWKMINCYCFWWLFHPHCLNFIRYKIILISVWMQIWTK